MYTAVIEYSYVVKDTEYHGDHFRPFKISSTGRSLAESTCARLYLGKEVDVLHHPLWPSKSMLREAALKTAWFVIILIIAIALISGGAIWMAQS